MMLVKNQENIEKILEKINTLPALPQIADEALRILNDPNSSKSDLVKIISKDQSFISKILTIANSPIYGLRREVSTMSFAVFVLGLKEIKKVVFAIAFMQSFKMERSKYFNPDDFWLHSFITANLSRKIAMDLDITNCGEAFVVGFLHDFAISIIHRDFKSEFDEIYELASTGINHTIAEKEILTLTHAEVAELVLENWGLPKIIVDAVKFHHTPSVANMDKALTSVIHLADYITTVQKIGMVDWETDLVLDESIIETLGFSSKESLEEFIESYNEFIKEQIESIRSLI
ncbi:MAG: HDOD domain-containing protein [Melioribacteraceae bacterium]|nr:HDOD domain-containing protein [Melioribacteraceae bacterium]